MNELDELLGRLGDALDDGLDAVAPLAAESARALLIHGGATSGTIRAGERLTRAMVVATRCRGTLTGSIRSTQNLGPGGVDFANPLSGSRGSLLVGRFTFTLGQQRSVSGWA